MMYNLTDCVQYFKRNKGFARLFECLREKYESLGHLGGTIVLSDINDSERDALRNFLNKDFTKKRTATIKIADIENALKNTKYEEFTLLSILEAYYKKPLKTKQQLEMDYVTLRREYFCNVLKKMKNETSMKWLNYVLETKVKPYQFMMKKYNIDSLELKNMLLLIGEALQIIEDDKESIKRLAVLSVEVVGNPHYFDEGSDADKLFTHALCFLLNREEPKNAEEKAEVLYQANIVKDDISNYTVCYGLEAYMNNETKHMGWTEFAMAEEPLQVSLANISKVDRVLPFTQETQEVYVVENPTVFSAILDSISKDISINVALVCTNGQIKLASLLLLDKLVKEGSSIYYSGDFDPEGLLIADRLKKRYKDKLILWRYSIEDYTLSLSEETINTARLNKLKKIEDVYLKEVASKMAQVVLAGYQEKIIGKYIEDLIIRR